MAAIRPSHEKFNDTYYDTRGIQPSRGRRRSATYNVETTRRPRRRGRKNRALAGDRATREEQYQREVREVRTETEPEPTTAATPGLIYNTTARTQSRPRSPNTTPRATTVSSTETSESSTKVSPATRRRATRTCLMLLAWGMSIWIFAQFWAGLLAIVGFVGDNVFSVFGGLIVFPGILAVGLILAMLLGWFTLLLIYVFCLRNRLHSVSGEAAGLKITFLLLAACMYVFPITSIFPWFIFWLYVIWRNPK